MIVGILGPGGCGGTFLDWSMHYLSGNTQRYVVQVNNKNRAEILQHGIDQITQNPIKGTTAHNHLKTHPNNESLQKIINIFKSFPNFDLHTFYYVDSMHKNQKQTFHNNIIESNQDLNFITFNFLPDDINKIFCYQFEKIPDVLTSFGNLELLSNQKMTDLSIWDQRELFSLYYPSCIRGQTIKEIIQSHANNFNLNFEDMCNNLDTVILDIFDFVSLKIDQSRWEHWLQIYNRWKEGNSIYFFQDLDKIIQNILNNIPQDLTPYNITFAKEIIIASELLYKHNLALRSYGVEKVGLNTKDWHALLEPNTYHNLDLITQENT